MNTYKPRPSVHGGIAVGVDLETAPRPAHHEAHHAPAEHEGAYERYSRRNDEFSAAGVMPASGNLLLIPDPFGPPAGFIWHVMGMAVAGATGVATLVGQADIFIGPKPTSATNGDVGQFWRDTSRYNLAAGAATQLPLSGWFIEWQLVVTPGMGIYCIVSGGVASTTAYTFSGEVIVEPDPASHTNRANLL